MVLAMGSSWTELLSRRDELDALVPTGMAAQLELALPVEPPGLVLDMLQDAGNRLGVQWVRPPYYDGAALVLPFLRRNPGPAAVIMALAAVIASLAQLAILGALAWKLSSIPTTEAVGLLQVVLIGALVLGGLLVLQGISPFPGAVYPQGRA